MSQEYRLRGPREGEKPTHVAVDADVAQAIVDHLKVEPFENVANLIAAIVGGPNIVIEQAPQIAEVPPEKKGAK